MGRAWKLHEKIKLASLWYADAGIKQMCSELDRTKQAVYCRARLLNLKKRGSTKLRGKCRQTIDTLLKPRKITDRDWMIYYLHSEHHLSSQEISDKIGADVGHVKYRMNVLGLTIHAPPGEPPEWYQQVKSGCNVFSEIVLNDRKIEV